MKIFKRSDLKKIRSFKTSFSGHTIFAKKEINSGGISTVLKSFDEFHGITHNKDVFSKYDNLDVVLDFSCRNYCQEDIVEIIDSKIALVWLYFYDKSNSKINIYTWNKNDLYYHMAKYLEGAKQVNLLDFKCRNSKLTTNLQSMVWNEEFISCQCIDSNRIRYIGDLTTFNYVGRLVYQKGVDIFFELAKEFPHCNFDIYGEGPYSKNIPNIPNLHFFGFKQNPICNFTSKDILIVPSRYFEGASLAVLEALNHGVRVISSGVGELSLISNNLHTQPKGGDNLTNFFKEEINKLLNN